MSKREEDTTLPDDFSDEDKEAKKESMENLYTAAIMEFPVLNFGSNVGGKEAFIRVCDIITEKYYRLGFDGGVTEVLHCLKQEGVDENVTKNVLIRLGCEEIEEDE